MDLENPINGSDSGCSTPYVSAPSSPGRGAGHNGYFFSAPASPMHFVLSSSATLHSSAPSDAVASSGSFEFDLSASACSAAADELFLNGQIRPMKQQQLAPLIDDDEEDEVEVVRGRDLRMRSRSMHRRTRSMSPLRRRWPDDDDDETERKDLDLDLESDADPKTAAAEATTTPSSSRSSSSGRNSKRWEFLKDLLYRSKSEGRGSTGGKEKFWHSLAFSSPSSSKSKPAPDSAAPPPPPKAQKKKAAGGGGSSAAGKRRASAHERHYTANRAAAEEMRRRTFLPYRQGLLGCLGFSSRGYGAVNGFARALNPVSSR